MKTKRWRSRHAQSLVEMALVLPLLAFLTFGLLDFGRAYYFQVSVTNAAREGARVAILNVYTGPQTPSCGTSNNYYVTVNVKYDFQLYTPLMQQLLGNPITMSVSVQMRTNY